MRLADPGRLELGPERDDQQDRQAIDARHREVQQLERGRVGPVRVLEDHQRRVPAGQPLYCRISAASVCCLLSCGLSGAAW